MLPRHTLIAVACLIGLASQSSLAGVAGYYRQPTVHGDQIVFNCEADLWRVSTSGGEAMRLTSHPANESNAYFSPDGKQLAFSGDYQGNTDVYVMPAGGGEPKQLTFHPSRETCVGWTPDGKYVLFSARRSGLDSELTLYKVPVDGGHPERVNVGVAESASFSPDGKQIAFTPFNWNGTWKRYRGGTAPEIWVGDLSQSKFWKLTNNDAVDQNPMWAANGRVYFLSERSFPVNIWSAKPDGSDVKQHTSHADYDARFADCDGKQIVYTVAGDIWLLDLATDKAKKLDVTLASDRIRQRPRVEDASKSLESFDLSSDGKRVVVSSRGELWNAPAKPGGRIIGVTGNSSATRERAATFSPDGKKVACITDATGEQELAIYDAAGKEPSKVLTHAGKGWLFSPVWSNDAKRIAFADLTGTLYVADAESGDTKAIDQDKNWELTEYSFSPDGKWIAYTKISDNRVQEVWVQEIDTGKKATVSAGFMNDYAPTWDPKGRYLYMLSNRVVAPELDEFDREFIVTETAKPCAVILQKDGKSPFLADELLGYGDDEDEDKADKSDGDDDAATTKPATTQASDSAKHEKHGKSKVRLTPTKVDLEGIALRVVQFPVESGNLGNLQASDDRVFWVSQPTRKMGGEDDDDDEGRGQPKGVLHAFELKKKKEENFVEGIAGFALSRDGSKLAWRKGGDIVVVDASQKPEKEIETKVALNGLPLEVNTSDEWKQIYNEAWRLQRDFYWADNMVGLDWAAMKDKYGKLLPRVATRGELNDIIGQLIGELGTSHTYVFGGDTSFRPPNPVPVGVLGADVEHDKDANLHKFVRVLRPEPWETQLDAPLTLPHANVHDGDYLIAINGKQLKPTDNADARLINQAGVEVLLTVCSKADKSDARDVQVKTLDDDTQLRYADWVRRNREYVNTKTSGRVGYFHLPDMGGAGLVRFVKGFYPQIEKDALIIDDRTNHGGFVSQMMIERLARKVWAYDRPRRGLGSTYPDRAHVGYKCVLIDEHSGSDGDIFPDSFRTLGLGPLIGKRTWGGVIGIRTDKAFVDSGMSSQPEFAWWDAKRGWSIENHGVDPDIEVEWRPEDRIAGRDPQLDRAIDEMMRMLKEKPIDKPKAPPFPVRVPPKAQTANGGNN